MVTGEQHSLFEFWYDWYNCRFFNNELPDCMITTSEDKNFDGIFKPLSWIDTETGKKSHWIILSANCFGSKPIIYHTILVHQMCHVWQYEKGKQSGRNYHDQRYVNKMEDCGLKVYSIGKFKGNDTGQNVTQ